MNTTLGATLHLSSALTEARRAVLEELLFFNPRQGQAAEAIVASIDRHGQPEIVSESGLLHIHVGELGRVQTLFAFEGDGDAEELVGVVAYSRLSREELVLLHIAVSEQFSSQGRRAHAALVLRLFQAVRDVAARLRGVASILMYHPGGPVRYPVAAPASAPVRRRM